MMRDKGSFESIIALPYRYAPVLAPEWEMRN